MMITKDPTQVEAKDEGKWTCNVGVVVNSEVSKSIRIRITNNQLQYNFSLRLF